MEPNNRSKHWLEDLKDKKEAGTMSDEYPLTNQEHTNCMYCGFKEENNRLRATVAELFNLLKEITTIKPEVKPLWGDEHGTGIYDYIEVNGWKVCAWDIVTRIENLFEAEGGK